MDLSCRDSFGLFKQHEFNSWSCSLCYFYLFQMGAFVFNFNGTSPGLVRRTNIGYTLKIETDEVVCASLGEYDCRRWRQCCSAAQACCERQQAMKPPANGTGNYCPRTWDGWSCFDDTPTKTRVNDVCPKYILYGSTQGHLEKSCTENGTWALHPDKGNEWTDYSKCVDIKGIKGVVYAGVVASAFSLLLLIPATFILLFYKQLRGQQRIQLHVCLFASFILTASLSLLWDLLIYDDRVENTWLETFMVQHKSPCTVINALLRYATSTNFFWMFCEGFYLYRLLVQAFRVPRHIKLYFAFGWVGPVVPFIAYCTVRWEYANDICWMKNAGWFEWIMYTPNFLCILVNMVFLLGILKILITQLHQHPNEPSHYRRAIKATFVLVPLFGLQLFLVIYRPNSAPLQHVYEISSKVIIDSQGGIIALVFCFFNKEVMTCIQTSVRNSGFWKRKHSPKWMTNYSVVSQKTLEAEHDIRIHVTKSQNGNDIIALKNISPELERHS